MHRHAAWSYHSHAFMIVLLYMSECGHFKRYSFEIKKKRQIMQQSDFLILFFSTQTCGDDPLTSVCNCL